MIAMLLLTLLIALGATVPTFAQHLINPDGVISKETKDKISLLLSEHNQITAETVGVFFSDENAQDQGALSDHYVQWAPSTKKPTNSALIRIKKNSADFEVFSGAGFGALLGSEGIDALRKNVLQRLSPKTPFDDRVELIIDAFLVQIESPVPVALSPIRNTDPVYPSRFPIWLLLTVFGILIFVCLGVLYRVIYSEIHLGAYLEKRTSPYMGKFRRARLDRDLISGGGISGHWDR